MREPIKFVSVAEMIDKVWKAATAIFLSVLFIIITFATDPKTLELILVILNFGFAVFYYVFLSKNNPPELFFKKDKQNSSRKSHEIYCKELDIKPNEDIGGKKNPVHKEERANELVKQFNRHIRGYILFLIVVYFFYTIQFSLERFLNIQDVEGLRTRYALFSLPFKVIVDIANFLSAISVYLAFKVLYDLTLDPTTNKPNAYKSGAIIFSICYIALYSIFITASLIEITNKQNQNQEIAGWLPVITHWFSLVAGILNGIVMALLFGRYVSMEHRIISRNPENKYAFISWGIVYILPVYAVIQPLFGSFNISSFGDPDKFRNFVFFVCLVGKVFFLIVTYIFIRERFIHLYMHLVITKHGVPNKFFECFDINISEKQNVNIDESGKKEGL
jgi:hypothetical protein